MKINEAEHFVQVKLYCKCMICHPNNSPEHLERFGKQGNIWRDWYNGEYDKLTAKKLKELKKLHKGHELL